MHAYHCNERTTRGVIVTMIAVGELLLLLSLVIVHGMERCEKQMTCWVANTNPMPQRHSRFEVNSSRAVCGPSHAKPHLHLHLHLALWVSDFEQPLNALAIQPTVYGLNCGLLSPHNIFLIPSLPQTHSSLPPCWTRELAINNDCCGNTNQFLIFPSSRLLVDINT